MIGGQFRLGKPLAAVALRKCSLSCLAPIEFISHERFQGDPDTSPGVVALLAVDSLTLFR